MIEGPWPTAGWEAIPEGWAEGLWALGVPLARGGGRGLGMGLRVPVIYAPIEWAHPIVALGVPFRLSRLSDDDADEFREFWPKLLAMADEILPALAAAARLAGPREAPSTFWDLPLLAEVRLAEANS